MEKSDWLMMAGVAASGILVGYLATKSYSKDARGPFVYRGARFEGFSETKWSKTHKNVVRRCFNLIPPYVMNEMSRSGNPSDVLARFTWSKDGTDSGFFDCFMMLKSDGDSDGDEDYASREGIYSDEYHHLRGRGLHGVER